MRRIPLAVAALLSLAACATAPEPDAELALARQVFELSGGFSEARLVARVGVPFALSEIDDVGERCRRALGPNSGPLGGVACEIATSALRTAQGDRMKLSQALDAQLEELEKRAPQALVDTYSFQELEAMRRHYASPEGRAIVEKRAEFWTNLMRGS